MRTFFLYIILLVQLKVIACQCPPTTLSLAECNRYHIIFRGKVDSVRTCEDNFGVAVFTVQELYKGTATKQFAVLFDCEDPCYTGFKPGEEWIIYGNYKQVTNVKMDWCSRSRKYIRIEKEDFYTANLGNDYDDEVKFLQNKLGLHRISESVQNAAEGRNKRPSRLETIVYLCVSLAAVIVFYWLFNKYFKF